MFIWKLLWTSTYLSGEECGSTLGHLQDDWGLVVASGLESSYDSRGGGNILSAMSICSSSRRRKTTNTYDGWDGKVVLLGVVEELEDIITNDDTGLASEDVLATHLCSNGLLE